MLIQNGDIKERQVTEFIGSVITDMQGSSSQHSPDGSKFFTDPQQTINMSNLSWQQIISNEFTPTEVLSVSVRVSGYSGLVSNLKIIGIAPDNRQVTLITAVTLSAKWFHWSGSMIVKAIRFWDQSSRTMLVPENGRHTSILGYVLV